MIFYGTHAFGWVDEVPGVGSVATRFFHIMWIPLIPLGSMFLVDGDNGYAIPLSIKSVIVAYVRAFLFWSALAAWVALPVSWGLSCCAAIPLTLGYLVMPLLVRKAGAARAFELTRQYGR